MAGVIRIFANVHWLWVIAASIALSLLNLVRHRFTRAKAVSRTAALVTSLALAAAFTAALILFRASQGAYELLIVFVLAWFIEDLAEPLVRSRGTRQAGN